MAKKLPSYFQYWTADEVAECSGVNEDTCSELWWKMGEEDLKPLGGDGSNGTTEEPIHSDSYGNSMPQVWPRLSPESQAEVRRAAVALNLEDRKRDQEYRAKNPNSRWPFGYRRDS